MATVVSQKELFERSSPSRTGENATSRYLLHLIDGWTGEAAGGAFDAALDEQQERLAGHSFERLRLERLGPDLERAQARAGELEAQIHTLDDPAAVERRRHFNLYIATGAGLDEELDRTRRAVNALRDDVATQLRRTWTPDREATLAEEHVSALDLLLQEVRQDVTARLDGAIAALNHLGNAVAGSDLGEAVRSARADEQLYLAELAAAGINPDGYRRLSEELQSTRVHIAELEQRLSGLEGAREVENAARSALMQALEDRRAARNLVIEEAATSGVLKFHVADAADPSAWSAMFRERLSLRSDGFLSEVPALARWITSSRENLETWQDCLRANQYGTVEQALSLRSQFWDRIRQLDERARLRLATEVPDDLVVMYFRREGVDPANDEAWQRVDSGSPGERTAAMLSLVLSHGSEPLVLDQPEDDLDTEWISQLVVRELRRVRWTRQVIVVTHNANIPVVGDADRVIVMENRDRQIRVREDGPVEVDTVRQAIQNILEGGVEAFVARERRYNNELDSFRVARGILEQRIR